MRTDLFPTESLLAGVAAKLRKAKQEPTDDAVAELVEAEAAHGIDLRFDRVLEAAEVQAIADAALAAWLRAENVRTAEPHYVHVDDPYEAIDPPLDEAGEPIGPPTGRRWTGPAHCPDCRRGLSSRGRDMICTSLPADTTVADCSPGRGRKRHDGAGCLVACGRPPD